MIVESALPSHLQPMTILVVDDLDDNVALLVELLEERGLENMETASDGKKAVEILEGDTSIDLVLLDINMPNMNGHEVLSYIKKRDHLASIPVIMVSAIDELSSVIRCIENGAEDYLTKPLVETLFEARVHASLERKYLRDKEAELFEQIRLEQQRAEQILYQVLPRSVADRLRQGENNIAEVMDDVTVVFASLVGFAELSSEVDPDRLVSVLTQIFGGFNELVERFRLEQIKTIGNACMVVGGIPPNTEGHAERCMEFALEAIRFVGRYNEEYQFNLRLRVGICAGPVVAGVIGQTRYTYDLWGETVNLASRMESLGLPDTIQVTEETFVRLASKFKFSPRGKIEVKGKGFMDTFLASSADNNGSSD